ncbi:hypothetical protein HXZ94_05935 [Empedobacter falsenii]|uniref:hypothetical protein n=1 Tax=Empedobacter falsenii TaxID=343874 RepID=UPI002574AEC8|nr:hypothetical protein [Empedobacter falsenii]MDM1298037.1 hypothetical protein [Empedobacter falsenii]MDM1317888.1 hypothetical protein [Empedobacter falsenii]
MIGSPQKVYLNLESNQNYSGYIISDFYRPAKYIFRIKTKNSEDINHRIDLDSEVVCKTMNELESQGIESLKKCEEIDECKKIVYLDGDGSSFKIIKGDKELIVDYNGIYPENKLKDNIEKVDYREKAQKLLTTLENNLDLKAKFRLALKEIKSPYCYFCGGTSTCCTK